MKPEIEIGYEQLAARILQSFHQHLIRVAPEASDKQREGIGQWVKESTHWFADAGLCHLEIIRNTAHGFESGTLAMPAGRDGWWLPNAVCTAAAELEDADEPGDYLPMVWFEAPADAESYLHASITQRERQAE